MLALMVLDNTFIALVTLFLDSLRLGVDGTKNRTGKLMNKQMFWVWRKKGLGLCYQLLLDICFAAQSTKRPI